MNLIASLTGLLISVFAFAQPGNTGVKWLTHIDSANNLSIDYPSNWQLKPPAETTLFFITSYPESDKDNFRENLNSIVPQGIQKGITIQMTEDNIKKTLSESLANFKIVHSGYSKWNNADAYEIEYTCTNTTDGVTYYLHMLQKVAIIKGKLYALTYTALSDSYNKYIAAIRRMIGSFKIM